jgi:NAD+ kinase
MAKKTRTIVIFHNEAKPQAQAKLRRLKAWFRQRGVCVVAPTEARKAEAAVALGGDGTLLMAARSVAPLGLPVLGINLGRLGFLAGTEPQRAPQALTKLLEGQLDISNRMMLTARSPDGSDHLAVNDCVIRSLDAARVIHLSAWVGGDYLAPYVGDGLILSTPTGSTAYSLAASGPIVQPELDLVLLTPICSHSLTQRPIILPPDSSVEVRLESHTGRERAMMSLDGQVAFPLRPGDRVFIGRAKERFLLGGDSHKTYFSTLREKLKWGER